MSTYNRSFVRTIKPLSALTRPALQARVETIRHALDVLGGQEDIDGGPRFGCTGSMKVELLNLEAKVRELDRAEMSRQQQASGVPEAWQQATEGGR